MGIKVKRLKDTITTKERPPEAIATGGLSGGKLMTTEVIRRIPNPIGTQRLESRQKDIGGLGSTVTAEAIKVKARMQVRNKTEAQSLNCTYIIAQIKKLSNTQNAKNNIK